MKKVLFILDNLEGGGAERVMANIANGFAAQSIRVEVLLGKKSGIFIHSLDTSIRVSEIGSTNFFAYLKAFPAIFRNGNYTHILGAGHYVCAATIIAKKRSGIAAKIFQTHHYSHPVKRPLKYWKGDLILKALYFITAPAADRIISVSQGSLEWLRKFSHRKLPQGMVIHNPVVEESLYTRALEELQLPTAAIGKKILLNIGRLSEQKDQATLLKAFQIYLGENPGAFLIILGTGPLKEELARMVKKLGLESDIFMAGFHENPYKWFARCDLFILSSQYEGFGNVIVEAMAFGKTVVSTDCPSGPAEIIQQGLTGYLCPVKDPGRMAVYMKKGIDHPLDSDLIRETSRQYEVSTIVKKYIDLL